MAAWELDHEHQRLIKPLANRGGWETINERPGRVREQSVHSVQPERVLSGKEILADTPSSVKIGDGTVLIHVAILGLH